MMRDQCFFQDLNFSQFCYLCNNFGHTLRSCPVMCYIPQKPTIIARSNKQQFQDRMKYFRKHANCRFFKATQNMRLVRVKARQKKLQLIN